MNGLSLCSGIGGLDLGIKLAVPSYQTVCYVEIEPFCQDVLLARMADGVLDRAPIYGDLRRFDARPWRGLLDIVHGGYPCQPFSVAGKRLGEADPRHLWPDVARIIRECEPRLCFFENVAGHLRLGFDVVARDLVDMGYRVAAGLFTAAEVGAPHRRQRLYILAHQVRYVVRDESGRRGGARGESAAARSESEAGSGMLGDADGARLEGRRERDVVSAYQLDAWPPGPAERDRWAGILLSHPHLEPATGFAESRNQCRQEASQPVVRRVADGLPHRVDRLKALGNGVVPAVAALAWRTLHNQITEGICAY